MDIIKALGPSIKVVCMGGIGHSQQGLGIYYMLLLATGSLYVIAQMTKQNSNLGHMWLVFLVGRIYLEWYYMARLVFFNICVWVCVLRQDWFMCSYYRHRSRFRCQDVKMIGKAYVYATTKREGEDLHFDVLQLLC